MTTAVEIDEKERALLMDVLLQEIKELQPLLHHTRSVEWKEGLRERMEIVEGLIERIEAVKRVPAV